jgi:hypothetical protein
MGLRVHSEFPLDYFVRVLLMRKTPVVAGVFLSISIIAGWKQLVGQSKLLILG